MEEFELRNKILLGADNALQKLYAIIAAETEKLEPLKTQKKGLMRGLFLKMEALVGACCYNGLTRENSLPSLGTTMESSRLLFNLVTVKSIIDATFAVKFLGEIEIIKSNEVAVESD